MAKQLTVSISRAPQKCENVEDLLKAVGGFGNFQLLMLILILCLEIPAALLIFAPVFIGATPNDWLCDNETISKSAACSCNGTLTPFDKDVSIVSEWGLICGASWVSDTITSLQMAGMLVGNIVISPLTDWYGRRYSFLGTVITMALGTVLTAVAPNPGVFAVARFICGAGFSGFLVVSGGYSMEFMTPKWRPLCACVGPFGEGIMLLGLLAYFVRPWRSLTWISLIPFAFIIITFPLVPESPRWLLRNQKTDDAYKVFSYMARLNGKKPIDKQTLCQIAEAQIEPKMVGKDENGGECEKAAVEKFSYLKFYRDPALRRVTLLLQGIWFTWGLVYFGLSYNIKNLPGNAYLNVVFMGLVDSIGYPSALLISNRLGRRRSLVIFMTLASIFLGTIAIMNLTNFEMSITLLAALCFLGRFGAAGARPAVRTLSGESFPTALRAMGLGLTGSICGVSAALAPQLALLGANWPALPFFVLAVISVGGSLISFALEETNGQPLQEQVQKNVS